MTDGRMTGTAASRSKEGACPCRGNAALPVLFPLRCRLTELLNLSAGTQTKRLHFDRNRA